MSGFFRNLSAQALGQSTPVRSAARLHYVALPAMFEPPAGDQTGTPIAAAPVASASAPTNATDRPSRKEVGIPHGTSSPPFPRRHDDAGNDGAGSEPLAARATGEPAGPRPVASALTPPAGFEPAAPVAPARALTPAPLVPPVTRFLSPPAFAPAPAAGAARTAGAHRGSASEAMEVHVSIGRIELTAVHEASPPARRAAPVKPSLPLREYLARRQRRPS